MQALSNLLGDNKILTILGLVVAVLVAIAIVIVVVRFVAARKGRLSTARGRQPRLAVVDAFDIDKQRQLVLIRRDNVEHLIMIGGPNDVLVESTIQRYQRSDESAGNSRGPVVGVSTSMSTGDTLRSADYPRDPLRSPEATPRPIEAIDPQPVLPALPPTMLAPAAPVPPQKAPAPAASAPQTPAAPPPQNRQDAPRWAAPAPRNISQPAPAAPAVKPVSSNDPRSAFMPSAKISAQTPAPPGPGMLRPAPQTRAPSGPGAPPVMMPMRGPAAALGRSDAPPVQQQPNGAPASTVAPDIKPPKAPEGPAQSGPKAGSDAKVEPKLEPKFEPKFSSKPAAKPDPQPQPKLEIPVPAADAPSTDPGAFDPLGSLEDDLAKLLGRTKS